MCEMDGIADAGECLVTAYFLTGIYLEYLWSTIMGNLGNDLFVWITCQEKNQTEQIWSGRGCLEKCIKAIDGLQGLWNGLNKYQKIKYNPMLSLNCQIMWLWNCTFETICKNTWFPSSY